jgi:hypothetical protein
MFCTTPCRSIPASTKLARGVGRGGSCQTPSDAVLGLCEPSAIVIFPSAAAFEGAGIKGLAIRDRVGLGVGVDIVAAAGDHLPPFLCDRESARRGDFNGSRRGC